MTSRYYTMTDSTGESGFLPTVTFDGSSGVFTSLHRTNTLSSIGITGFYEADFSNTVTDISYGAFQNDSKVVVVTINKVATIRDYAFNGCTAMRSITLDTADDGIVGSYKYLLTSIGTNAFQGCTSLRNLHIPDTVKIIPDNMCNGCTSLELAVMGYGWNRNVNNYVTDSTIGSNAFNNCYSLSYFVVPETVRGINDSAFANNIALTHFYILGTPDVSSNAFFQARSNTTIYYYNLAKDVSNCFPGGCIKRAYTEYTITATGALTPATVRSTIPANTYWKGKIANSVTSLAQSCFAGDNAGADIKYPYMVAISLPPALTSIGYGAFMNSDGASGYSCIVGAFYIPNSVTTLVTINNTSNTFAGFTEALRNTSTTKQIVFQSGPNTIAFPAYTCKFSSAMAIIVPNVTSFGQECFNYANKVQLYSFFQKNAYTSATRLDHTTDDGGQNIFSNGFNKGVAGYTHYLYIPKKITRMSTNSFQVITDKLYVTAYNNYNLTTDTNGLGFGYLTYGAVNTGLRFTGTAPTFHLINNYYNANGLTLNTVVPGSAYHVLFPPEVNFISERFKDSTNLKTVTIPDTVTDISKNAFMNCTGLTKVYISPNSNLTSLRDGVFYNCTALTSFFIPNSLDAIPNSTFSECTSLASVTYGNNPGIKYISDFAFYGATKALTSIFIPASVVSIGNSAFICGAGTNILNTVTFGAGSRLKSINYQCFGLANAATYSATYLRDLVLPNSIRAIGGNQAFRNAFTQVHSANLIFPTSLEFLSESILYTERGASTLDISNIYLPLSITNVPGPRNHSGYITSGVGLNVFSASSSKTNSLIYLPSHLSEFTGGGATTFPDTNRTRSYYKTVSFTTNPLLSLALSSTNPITNAAGANITNATTTTQIHADIKNGVIVIGGGTSIASANSGNVLNLISVNIPSTVTDICANAFNGCSALAYVTFSENSKLTTIGNSAFLGCSTIPDIQLPDTLTTIGPNAFSGCNNLASISIPYNVTSIGANAFGANAFARSNLIFGTKLGQDIDGEAASDESGYSVSMNSDGTIVAIGAYLNDGTTGTDTDNRGHVRVYKYQTITDTTWANYTVNSFVYVTNKPIVVNGGDALPVANKKYWVQMGSDIDGEAAVRVGYSVSLSSDGMTVAIGAPFQATNTGYVRVYNYDSGKTTNVTDQTSNDFGPIGWRRLGKDIAGEATSNVSGSSVSLSSDGTTVAIGAYGNTSNTGQVRVYKYQTITDWTNYTINSFVYDGGATSNKPIVVNGGDANPVANKYYWVQQGVDIDGEAASNFSGWSVSLSSDGTIVAIGAFGNTGVNGATSGHVRVYKYQTIPVAITTWTNNYTANSFIYNGTSPTDKPIVVNGGDANPISGKYYWVQQGVDIDGEATTDWSGRSVSLSDDGTIVAIGAIRNDGTPVLADRGHVRVYKYDSGKTTNVTDQASNDFGPIGWRRLGQDIDGEAASDYSGWSVSLSSDGTTVAIGAPNYTSSSTGQVRIYKYDSAKTTNVTDQTSNDFGPIGWRRLGQDIDGASGDQSGTSVSLSKDGYTVAIGAPSNTSSKGRVRVYTIDQVTVPIRLHQRLYNDISGSLQTYFPGISTSSFQVIPALTLTNTLNPSKLTISQINNMYIRYRQSQLGFCTFVTVSASSEGTLTASDVTTALSGTTGLVHLDISTNVTIIYAEACNANTRIYSVAIPASVASIGFSAFNGCTNLTYLSFHPDSVCTGIGDAAFHNIRIFDLALPDSLKTIGGSAFQTSPNLTSVCIPKNVTALGANVCFNCSKLTSVAVPATLSDTRNATYFNTDGTNTTAITFSSYSISAAIPHFKLSDYSMPNGIVQNVVDSAVTYIDHRAYAYYPDITLYAVTTNKQTQTAGQYNYVMNGIKMPFMPAAFALNGTSVVSNYAFPLYRSVPDLNVFSLDGTVLNWQENTDNYYILMPGYSICLYNNLYDEENLFTDAPTYQYYDNEFGTVPLNIAINVVDTTSSLLILFKGRILSKYFNS